MNPTIPLPKTERGAIAFAMIVLVLFCWLFGGCTTAYHHGAKVYCSSSDVRLVHIKEEGFEMTIEGQDNSSVHKTIGANVAKGATSIGAAIATSGITTYIK